MWAGKLHTPSVGARLAALAWLDAYERHGGRVICDGRMFAVTPPSEDIDLGPCPDILTVARLLASRGVRVILAGTDTDFRGEPFGSMGELMAVAEIVDKLQAICVVCGDPACRNQRLIDGKPARYDSPIIMVGGRESYEARCRHCHKVPRRDEDQTALL